MYRQLSLAGQGYICCTGVIVGKSQTSKYTQVEFRYCMLETNFCNLNSFFSFLIIFFLIWLSNDFRQSTRYICSDPSCEGNEGNHFIRIHVPGALEFETIRSVV